MAKFNVKWTSTGLEQICEQSDCHTVEQLRNCMFGTCDSSGVEITLIEDEADEAAAEVKPPVKVPQAPKAPVATKFGKAATK